LVIDRIAIGGGTLPWVSLPCFCVAEMRLGGALARRPPTGGREVGILVASKYPIDLKRKNKPPDGQCVGVLCGSQARIALPTSDLSVEPAYASFIWRGAALLEAHQALNRLTICCGVTCWKLPPGILFSGSELNRRLSVRPCS